MLDRKELEAKAAELGIQFNAQWKDETLAKKVEEAELALLEKQTDPENEEQVDLDLGDEAAAAAAAELEFFATTHNADFFAGGIEFKKGASVGLTKEQQEIPAVKNSIGSMLKAV